MKARMLCFVLSRARFGFSNAPAAQPNSIQTENAKPGSTDWLLTKVKRHDDEIYELGWHRRKGDRGVRFSHQSSKPARR